MADQQVGNVHGLPIVAVGDADSRTNLSGTADPRTGFSDADILSITAMRARLATVPGGYNAIYEVYVDGATSGNITFTHDANTTAGVAWNADAATVKAALEALASIDTVTVTGAGTEADPWVIEFTGTTVKGFAQTLTAADATLDAGTVELEQTQAGQNYYTDEVLNKLSYNDMVYAIRTLDNPLTIAQ